MKKIFLIVILVSFIISGCNVANNEQIKKADSISINGANVNTTSQSSESPESTPQACEVARIYSSEQDLNAAVKDGSSKQEAENMCSLEEINYYFVPEAIPDGMKLDHIAVKEFYIALYYLYDDKPDPEWERTFMIEWERTLKSGDIKTNVERLYAENSINQKDGYYIIKAEPSKEYTGDKEYVHQNVYWEQNGYSFHSVVPITFTEEDIAKYCKAVKIAIE
jgi:hypothetical protein